MSPRVPIPPDWLLGKDMVNYSMNWIWVAWTLGPWAGRCCPCQLLAKYHNVFSLDPVELGCTHSTEHMIKVTDDTPFKEQFRWIPPPLVEEVQNHLWEMLESGAIWPSQSAWCNAVVLVRKKDGGLWFCIDFCHLNACTKKDSLPPAQNTGGVGEFGRCWTFFLLGPQIRVLADKDGRGIKAVHCLHSR